MSRRRIAWQDGEARIQRWIDACWAASFDEENPRRSRGERLHESSRRLLYRLESPRELSVDASGAATIRGLVIKVHRTHSGRHAFREALKRRIGQSPALREWQALVELHAARVPVPEPLAWGVLPGGDPLVVTEYFEGRALARLLDAASEGERWSWIDRLAESVARLHAAGYRHGDLHLGNLHGADETVKILDVQRAHRLRSERERLRDLAQLDFSIARAGFDIALRRRLRERLEAPPELDTACRAFVRDFVRGRARREFRTGRAWSAWQPAAFDELAGLLDATASRSGLESALQAAIADPRPGDRRSGRTRISEHAEGRSTIVAKRTTQVTWGRIALDRLRGPSALRSFRMGQRLALLGTLAARPLGALEEREPQRPQTSWLFLEKVGQRDLDRYRPATESAARRCCEALADWIAEWQAWGIEHRDLKASNIRIDDRDGHFRFWLVDLEDIRLRRRPSDRSRLRALVQLNASLADDAFSATARKHGLDRYLDRLPFAGSNRRELVATLAQRSLARQHRWQGLGCAAMRPDP